MGYYVTSKFNANARFAELKVREHGSVKDLLSSILEKAEDVFLWVCLVVRSQRATQAVQYLHRSVRDYVENTRVWS